jgi:hypothetical protein
MPAQEDAQCPKKMRSPKKMRAQEDARCPKKMRAALRRCALPQEDAQSYEDGWS